MIQTTTDPKIDNQTVSFASVVCKLAQAHFDPSIELNKVDLPKLSSADTADLSQCPARARMSACAVEAIAVMFTRLSEWVESHPDVLGLGALSESGRANFILTPYTHEFLRSELQKENGVCGRIIYLEGCAHSVLNHFSKIALDPSAQDTDLYQRYAAVMGQTTGAGGYGDPRGHIGSGNSTGISIMFGIAYAALGSLERVAKTPGHRDQVKAEALRQNEAELIEFLSHSLSSALGLSKIQVNALVALEAPYFADKLSLARHFTPDFSGRRARLHMFTASEHEFVQRGINALHEKQVKGAIWTNCPATQAITDQGNIATSFLRDWVCKIVATFAIERAIVPN